MEDRKLLIDILNNKRIKSLSEYHFRPVLVDGVYCYFVLYLQHNMLTVESVNVKCEYEHKSKTYVEPYVLYHRKYKNINHALKQVETISKNYKILNGDLESYENYTSCKLEESVLPYAEHEQCSICLEHTTDITSCNHYVCFHCRDKCIVKRKTDCPICRKSDVMFMYNNSVSLLNNRDFGELNYVLHATRRKHYDLPESDLEPESEPESESDSDDETQTSTIVEDNHNNDNNDTVQITGEIWNETESESNSDDEVDNNIGGAVQISGEIWNETEIDDFINNMIPNTNVNT
jgi:hypothetical protein